MKKIVWGSLLSSFLAVQGLANCDVLNFGPNEKSSRQIVDFQSVYATKGRVYRDAENKLQIKGFNDSYGEFFAYLQNTAIKECKANKYQGVVNVNIKYIADENYFYFSATYNYIK
jgi:uncharacterized protein involved in tolerance to divalent cations